MIRILTAKRQGQDIRHQGEEFLKGDLLLPRGTMISAPQAAIQATGGVTIYSSEVADEKQATREAIEQAGADIILCTGGVSVGRHDHVKEAAEVNGFIPLFWKIRQKPSKPPVLCQEGKYAFIRPAR